MDRVSLTRRAVIQGAAASALAFYGAQRGVRIVRAQGGAEYDLIDFGAFEVQFGDGSSPAPFGEVVELSESGVAIGRIAVSESRFSPATWSAEGKLKRLKSGKAGGRALGINSAGDVVGIDNKGEEVPYIPWPVAWIGGERITLEIPERIRNLAETPAGWAEAINDSGIIVGSANNVGVRWVEGTPEILPAPDDVELGPALCINAKGTILGLAKPTGAGFFDRPAIWDDAGLRFLELPAEVTPEHRTTPLALDDDDSAFIDISNDSAPDDSFAVLVTSDSAQLVDLREAGFKLRCNDFSNGKVVGLAESLTDDSFFPAVIDVADPTPRDLNELIPSDTGLSITRASAINSSGMIAGLAKDGDAVHGYLLIPAS